MPNGIRVIRFWFKRRTPNRWSLTILYGKNVSLKWNRKRATRNIQLEWKLNRHKSRIITSLLLKLSNRNDNKIVGLSSQFQSLGSELPSLLLDKSRWTSDRSPKRCGRCSMQLSVIINFCKLQSDKICASMLYFWMPVTCKYLDL